MEFCPIYSGSSGNCVYVGNDRVKLLVDAGLTGKKIESGLGAAGINPGDIDAILITHEHDDHIKSAGILSRRFNIPIYANNNTWEAMYKSLGNIKEENIKVFDGWLPFEIGDITVVPFSTPHDAANPCGYSFIHKRSKVSVATDIGYFSSVVKENIKDSNAILLEANHDVEMLKVGPYPYNLKLRILSKTGHLSNEDSGKAIASIMNSRIKTIYLGHLSRTNNYPELAYRTVVSILESNDIKDGKDLDIEIAHRERVSKKIIV